MFISRYIWSSLSYTLDYFIIYVFTHQEAGVTLLYSIQRVQRYYITLPFMYPLFNRSSHTKIR